MTSTACQKLGGENKGSKPWFNGEALGFSVTGCCLVCQPLSITLKLAVHVVDPQLWVHTFQSSSRPPQLCFQCCSNPRSVSKETALLSRHGGTHLQCQCSGARGRGTTVSQGKLGLLSKWLGELGLTVRSSWGKKKRKEQKKDSNFPTYGHNSVILGTTFLFLCLEPWG